MTQITARVKKWGNSVGVILPKELKLKPDEKIVLTVQKKKTTTVRDMFGLLNKHGLAFKHSTSKLLREMDEELDSEF